MEAPKPVSLEDTLTRRYESQLAGAKQVIEEATRHLSRVALIYGGQMQLDVFGRGDSLNCIEECPNQTVYRHGE